MFDLVQLPFEGVDAVVLAGGLGTRLRSVVDNVPKPLAPVLGRPFLFYQLDMLALRGVRSVTLCCGYEAEKIMSAVGSNWLGMPVNFSLEDRPMGTGGALAAARSFLDAPEVLVLNGDTWCEPDLAALRRGMVAQGVSMTLVRQNETTQYGVVDIHYNRVTRFSEKSGSSGGCVNAGVYLFSIEALGSLRSAAFSLERDFLPGVASTGRLGGCLVDRPFLDIGVPERYSQADAFFETQDLKPVPMFPDSPAAGSTNVKLGTCAVITNPRGEILMEKRRDCSLWGLPGGRLEPGESLQSGALREVKEETGLDVEIKRFVGVFSDPRRRTIRYPDNGDLCHLVDAVVHAIPVGGDLRASAESFEVAWHAPVAVPLNTAPPVIEILRATLGAGCEPVLR